MQRILMVWIASFCMVCFGQAPIVFGKSSFPVYQVVNDLHDSVRVDMYIKRFQEKEVYTYNLKLGRWERERTTPFKYLCTMNIKPTEAFSFLYSHTENGTLYAIQWRMQCWNRYYTLETSPNNEKILVSNVFRSSNKKYGYYTFPFSFSL